MLSCKISKSFQERFLAEQFQTTASIQSKLVFIKLSILQTLENSSSPKKTSSRGDDIYLINTLHLTKYTDSWVLYNKQFSRKQRTCNRDISKNLKSICLECVLLKRSSVKVESLCAGVSFLIKLEIQASKWETPAQMFSYEFYKISSNTFLQNTSRQLIARPVEN